MAGNYASLQKIGTYIVDRLLEEEVQPEQAEPTVNGILSPETLTESEFDDLIDFELLALANNGRTLKEGHHSIGPSSAPLASRFKF